MSGPATNPFRQPKAVFAVAFACVVSFMGIGLVDPILPAISHQLHASPSEVTLLFTSYLVVTAVGADGNRTHLHYRAGTADAAAPASAPARVIPVPAGSLVPPSGPTAGVLVAAVDDTPMASIVSEAAAQLAAHGRRTVHVVHAREAAVGGDVGVDGEDLDASSALVARYVDQIAAHRVPVQGQILLHAADHGAAGRIVAGYANDVRATTLLIGAPTHGSLSVLMDASSSRELMRVANSNVLIINPAAPQAPARSAAPAGPPTADQAAVTT